MTSKKILLIAIPVLVLLLISASALAAKPNISSDVVVWELTKTVVVDPGQTVTMEEGILTTGYTVEAKARSKGGNLVPEGTFRLTFDVFAPSHDLPPQKAGMWYVVGSWTITKKDASPESTKLRHSPDVVRGRIKTELPFNPLEGQKNWSALASLPMSPAAGRWGRGAGSLALNARLEGELFLDLKLWPEMTGRQP